MAAAAARKAEAAEERTGETAPVRCELAVLACSPRRAPLDNVVLEGLEASLHLPASVLCGGTFNDLRRLLGRRATQRFLFAGHANARFGSARLTLGLTTADGRLAPPPPFAIAALLGRHSPRHGGDLEFVMYNGCKSERIALLTLLSGVDYVCYWRTPVETTAARFLCAALFEAVARRHRAGRPYYRWAFDEACGALVGEPRPVQWADAPNADLPMRWEMRDPEEGPQLGRYPLAAGVPVLLTPRDRKEAARTLLRAAMLPRIALRAWVCRARERHALRIQTRSELLMTLARRKIPHDAVLIIMQLAGQP
ncbi:hypothetical protein EMIHUDRAFT_437872 [Emiliania huxleyi CCMP1516]|uniref:CHAT domain-containing protein n=2 Tax=Emiliania huxleyi TaxID=2903 RepID=A0A0D3IGV3_EMIH1|nr:hypothetical protein EMIHUDRAFT_437872 [Emiliania huxleyi CCMP1516]EOD10488.1 hypothetical protein EMIHUDRAFT_437872 [Emiliania huxleyi CCMP1516]|eukprot:XP_005762917.1 hypothetical protein EMIHUDRAFT_437872 [Emiliania huxleyi CCMP1516]